jgi:hypothetical protein
MILYRTLLCLLSLVAVGVVTYLGVTRPAGPEVFGWCFFAVVWVGLLGLSHQKT